MNAIEPVLRQPAAQAIGWALLQFVWQGAVIGLLTASVLRLLHRSAADVRYVVSTIALALMLTMPVVTALQAWRVPAPIAVDDGAASQLAGAPASGFNARRDAQIRIAPIGPAPSAGGRSDNHLSATTPRVLDSWLPALLVGWLTGVLVLTLRLMSGWLWIQHLKSRAVMADEGWQHMATRLCRRLHLTRGVRLRESTLLDVPTVIGWIKPVVLLPASALSGLTAEQLEAILAHELAHIRRHDYLINLLQTLVETLLFYHPAVWWLSHRIRVERENCCDDLAVSLCGDPYAYARALADLEQLRGANGRLALAANGGSLLQRVRRLLGAPSHAGRAPGWLAGMAAVALIAAMAAGAFGTKVADAQQASTAAAEPVVAAAPAHASAAQSVTASTAPAARPDGEIAAARARQMVEAANSLPAVAATPDSIAGTRRVVMAQASTDDSMRAMEAAQSLAIAALPSERQSVMTSVVSATGDASAVAAIASQETEAASTRPAAAARHSQRSGNFVWSHNGQKLEVSYSGDIEFTDDDKDVRALSPGGHLTIRDDGWFSKGRTVEFRADASGKLTRRFWVNGSERPFEPEGREWVAQALPRFIRQTGIRASARVARILASKGVTGVLAEISQIEGSWAKRLYFTELLKSAALDASGAQRVLAQASREVESDFELASLLIAGADKLLLDDATRKAYFDAARSIGSDFEMRRVFSSALKKQTVSSAVLAGLLDASRGIDSDFELASLLVQVAGQYALDQTTRGPFFAALSSVGSDFERGRVLKAVVARNDLTPDTVFQIVRATSSIGSDFEASQVLQAVAASHPITGEARDVYIDTAAKLGDFEQGRVLSALVKNERRK